MSKDVAGADAVGLDDARVERLLAHVHEAVESGLLPAAQVAIARHRRLAVMHALGTCGPHDRFVLQSAGRPVVAALAWRLLDDGLLSLEDTVASVVPQFATNGKDSVTVEQVLLHTAGLPFAPLGYPKMLDRAERLAAFGRWRLDYEPGTALQFHLTSAAWIIAELVERLTAQPIADFLRTEIAEPFGLSLQLGVPVADQDDVLPMTVTDRRSAEDEVDPWGPWYLARPEILAAGEPSHSVVGSAADLALFFQAVEHSGVWSQRIVAEATRVRLSQCPRGEELYGGSGTAVNMGLFVTVAGTTGGNWMPTAGSPRIWGHGGAAYQLGLHDPSTGVSFACLSNGYPLSGYDTTPRGVEYLATLADLAATLADPDSAEDSSDSIREHS